MGTCGGYSQRVFVGIFGKATLRGIWAGWVGVIHNAHLTVSLAVPCGRRIRAVRAELFTMRSYFRFLRDLLLRLRLPVVRLLFLLFFLKSTSPASTSIPPPSKNHRNFKMAAREFSSPFDEGLERMSRGWSFFSESAGVAVGSSAGVSKRRTFFLVKTASESLLCSIPIGVVGGSMTVIETWESAESAVSGEVSGAPCARQTNASTSTNSTVNLRIIVVLVVAIIMLREQLSLQTKGVQIYRMALFLSRFFSSPYGNQFSYFIVSVNIP